MLDLWGRVQLLPGGDSAHREQVRSQTGLKQGLLTCALGM